jgi:hypothetical protein
MEQGAAVRIEMRPLPPAKNAGARNSAH